MAAGPAPRMGAGPAVFWVSGHADQCLVHTYEGIDSVQSLILDREVTGISAFNGA
ncbi:hypothetical protein [Arthrobacter cavernae]|uniref:Uncharacterized protein n=1 Tax=Arthrobacter cavernae TaxID=2817681 RepID=A0A939HH24_9MICC|nr:hypothetical protein [Arthrobacter cavernae]MBO1267746.1 hypothetical protein [Arthrobacter cavernae]